MCWIKCVLDIMTAVGTVGATVVALWLALRDDQPRINGVFVWDTATEYKPTLMVQNNGNRIAVIESVEVFYKRHRVSKIHFSDEYSLRNYMIVEAGEVKKVPLESDWFHVTPPSDDSKAHTLKVVITPRLGRKNVSKQKYSYRELCELFFATELFSDE